MYKKLVMRLMPFALLMLPTLASCAHLQTQIAETAKSDSEPVVCSAFHALSYSRNDTDLTIEQIKEFDAAWRTLCPSK